MEFGPTIYVKTAILSRFLCFKLTEKLQGPAFELIIKAKKAKFLKFELILLCSQTKFKKEKFLKAEVILLFGKTKFQDKFFENSIFFEIAYNSRNWNFHSKMVAYFVIRR